MRKNTIIKFFITMSFVFMALTLMLIPIFADEPETTTIDINPAVSVEIETPEEEQPEETQEEEKSAFEVWLESLDVETVKGWIIALMAKLGIDTAVIFAMLIYFVKSKVRDAKTTKFYEDLMAKMDAEHQKKLEDATDQFVKKLDELQAQVTNEIKKANSEERKAAKENVEKMKEALSEINVELEK